MLDVALLIGGLIVLTFSADAFVLGATKVATALRLSPVLVGAVVIGFGTSAPELIVSVLASAQGAQDLAFGNIVGSNTANLLLVLGAAGLVRPLRLAPATRRRELPLAMLAMAVLALVTLDGQTTTVDGIVLWLVAVVTLTIVIRGGLRSRGQALALPETGVCADGGDASSGLGRPALVTLAGLIGTLAGAQALVTGATGAARSMGLSEAVIGLTIVAIGTSLPELVTSLAAARRGETDLIVGNVLGSNIFNSLPVAGTAALLDTSALDDSFRLSIVVMIIAGAVTTAALVSGRRVRRGEAVVLLVGFAAATWATFSP